MTPGPGVASGLPAMGRPFRKSSGSGAYSGLVKGEAHLIQMPESPPPMNLRFVSLVWCALLAGSASLKAGPAEVALGPPLRPLPTARDWPLGEPGRRWVVDAVQGLDEAPGDGSVAHPWRTLGRALGAAGPGDTILLRAGLHYGHSVVTLRATPEAPLTIRSFPGEIAVIDGGRSEFFDDPPGSWEPFPAGGDGEFRSIKSYPLETVSSEAQTSALGHFAGNMVPLHGYRIAGDLRSANEYFSLLKDGKTGEGGGIYCGPGLWHDPESGRLHVRLAHTSQTVLGKENYQGPTDPRQVRLCVATSREPALMLDGAAHVVLRGLVLRGSVGAPLVLRDCANVLLEGVTLYGGASALQVTGTRGLRCGDCAFRGLAAPWTWRGSLKYRAIESRLVSASHWSPPARGNADFEFARCEFTDSVDGVFIGGVGQVEIHHCLLDNVSDDGVFLTCNTAYDGSTRGGPVRVHHNVFSRCLSTFAFGVGHGRQKTIGESDAKQLGAGVWIYRNLFDYRQTVHYQQPGPEETAILTYGRFSGDHGSPGWEPLFIYHNTFLDHDPPWRSYYGSGTGKAMGKGTKRRILNNLFWQEQGLPGEVLPEGSPDFSADGNLHWSVGVGAAGAVSHLQRYRSGAAFPGQKWTEHDRWGDPGFLGPEDQRISASGRAVNAGVSLEKDWPEDRLLAAGDAGAPDVGMIPLDAEPWRIGIRGRLDAFGHPAGNPVAEAPVLAPFLDPAAKESERPKVALIMGYPAFDAPLWQYALEKRGAEVIPYEKTWLAPEEWQGLRAVVYNGDLTRAKMDPNRFTGNDAAAVKAFFDRGGVLLTTLGTAGQIFAGGEGKALLEELTGEPSPLGRLPAFVPTVRLPDHDWVAHLPRGGVPDWAAGKAVVPLPWSGGENLVGGEDGRTILGSRKVGRGRWIHLGWSVAASLPAGRLVSTVEGETAYEAQYQIMEKVVGSVLP